MCVMIKLTRACLGWAKQDQSQKYLQHQQLSFTNYISFIRLIFSQDCCCHGNYKFEALTHFMKSTLPSKLSLHLSLYYKHTHKHTAKTNHHFLHKSLLIDLSLLSGDSLQHINQCNWNSWLHHFTPHPSLRDFVRSEH